MSFQRVVLVLAAAGVLAAGATAASPKPRNVPTATPVTGLAADGSIVAIATAWSTAHCERVSAWNTLTGSLRGLGKGGRCDETSTGRGIAGQAVAGARVAWIADGGGNQHDAVLYTASLTKPSVTHRLLLATRSIDSGAGNWVGGLRGAGSLLVYATWSVCDTGDAPFRACPAGVTAGTVYNSKLWRIDGLTGKKLIGTAPDALIPVGVAAGRVLVVRGDGSTFELRGADGHVIRTFDLGAPAMQAAVGTKDLYVAVRGAANPPLTKALVQFEVYSLSTGALERTIPAAATSLTITPQRCSSPVGAPPSACVTPTARLRFGNADATRLVYILDASVKILRGSTSTSATAPGGAVFAQLLKTGYAYSYPTGRQGRVLYLPSP